MEVLDQVLAKMGVKKKFKPVVINIIDIKTKSCGNCQHLKKPIASRGQISHRCMHYPDANIIDVVNKICTTSERKLWTPKQDGVLTRFFHWLF